jgi:hypothetical protein
VARRRLALFGPAALLSVALLAVTTGSPAAGASGQAAAPRVVWADTKKKCKIVIKIVHGKKRKVRVCHTVKPKPKPTVKNVALSLDAGRAATQTIGAEGGSVTASAANGTTYTLALPADALVGPTEVQVIPVKSVTGLGGHARVVGAVQLEPEGLGLFKPATLTITASSLSGKPTQAISWYGAGRTLGRYPSKRTGTQLVLQITHFSGDGVAQGESSDWSNWESATDAVRAYYQQTVRPLMTKAETDDSVFFQATQVLTGWERQLQLLDFGDDFMAAERAALFQSFEKAFRNAVDKSSERCVNQHKLGEITILLIAARQAALLGNEQLSNDAVEKATKCGHFELDYETIMTSTAQPPNFSSELKVESHVRVLGLQLDILKFLVAPVTGEKQIEYLSWSYTGTATVGDSSCSYTPDGIQLGDPFRVTRLSGVLPRLKAVAGPDGRPQFDPPSISLSVYPGKPMESANIECSDGFRDVIPVQPWYFAVFSFLNYQQAEGDSYQIDGWDFLGGSVYARKTFERTRVSTEGLQQMSTERTTYDLRHTPQS